MKKTILLTIITILIVITLTNPAGAFFTQIPNSEKTEEKQIFYEIENTFEKKLQYDEDIGDIHVEYWLHYIDQVLVKNDSILLQKNGNRILNYERKWTEISFDTSILLKSDIHVDDFFWKKAVVFPEKNDLNKFYNIYENISFPLLCWEVRYKNGTTKLINTNGKTIGNTVSTPSKSYETLALQGEGDHRWCYWRTNAQNWFSKWDNCVQSKINPNVEFISRNIKEQKIDLFYVIAHSDGRSDQFLAKKNQYYTSQHLKEDMKDRYPIKLAFLCCCEAMTNTGKESLSYEFRKGNFKDTSVIGYTNMSNCSGWPTDAYYWQDLIFEKISHGWTIKKAFEWATARFPSMNKFVIFIGDSNQRIINQISKIFDKMKNTMIFNNFLTGIVTRLFHFFEKNIDISTLIEFKEDFNCFF